MNKIKLAGMDIPTGIVSLLSFLLKGLLLVLLFLLPNTASSQEIRLEASLDTTEMLIGDQIKFRFHVNVPPGSNVDFPMITDTLTSGIEVLKTGQIDTLSGNNSTIRLSQELLITSFDSGFFKIPPYPFIVSTPKIKDTLFSSPVFLTVHTLEVDTTKAIFDIKEPYTAPFTFKEGLPYLLIIIGVLGFGFVIFYFFRKRKRNEPIFKPAKIVPPPHLVALDELEKLEKEKLWQQGKIKIYYVRLTGIIRIYIEDRFHVPAMEQITEEIMDGMKVHYPQDDPVMFKLNQMLELSDLAKFAKFLPDPSENKLAMEYAYSFVLATKPAELTAQVINKQGERIENAGTKIEA